MLSCSLGESISWVLLGMMHVLPHHCYLTTFLFIYFSFIYLNSPFPEIRLILDRNCWNKSSFLSFGFDVSLWCTLEKCCRTASLSPSAVRYLCSWSSFRRATLSLSICGKWNNRGITNYHWSRHIHRYYLKLMQYPREDRNVYHKHNVTQSLGPQW